VTTALWLVAVAVVLWGQRAWRARAAERRFAAKFAVGADGIIVGAEPRLYESAGSRALLLFHGYNDSPQTLDRIAKRVSAAGWTVRVPLLPGHGRSLRAFDDWRAEEVFAVAREEYAALRAIYPTVAVGGLSMGGALACWLAAEADVDAVVLYAPMLFVPRPMEVGVHTARLWSALTKYLVGGSSPSVLDPGTFRSLIAYKTSTRRSLEALERIARETIVRLGFVHAPIFIAQSVEDNRLPRDQSERAHARLGTKDRTVEWVTGAGHVLTVDYGWEGVADRTIAWLGARFPQRRRSTEIGRVE
jgi:carboxylesterase